MDPTVVSLIKTAISFTGNSLIKYLNEKRIKEARAETEAYLRQSGLSLAGLYINDYNNEKRKKIWRENYKLVKSAIYVARLLKEENHSDANKWKNIAIGHLDDIINNEEDKVEGIKAMVSYSPLMPGISWNTANARIKDVRAEAKRAKQEKEDLKDFL